MSPKLKPLLLPQLVEERRKRESLLELDMESAQSSFCTQSSSPPAEMPSPVTPTFSTRHLRYPSSASSLESSFHSATVDSPASQTFVGSTTGKSSKRSLPDVQEEPHERDFDMFDDDDDDDELYDCLCDGEQCLHRDSALAQSSVQLSTKPEFDYDLADGFFSDGEFSTSPRHKRRRAVESPLTGLTTRFVTRFPSFSRRWRMRKPASSVSSISEARREDAASRGASSRSSSVSVSGRQFADKSFEASMPSMPPTPTKSVFNSYEEIPSAFPIDIEKANRNSAELEENQASTPLLPPLMMDASANMRQVAMQSPLQSPSVAEANDPFSGTTTPIDSITTSQLPGMPSPPLSTKLSVSSFQRNNIGNANGRPGHLTPSSEIPPIVIADPNDEWANKLGHANFTIHPEPYLPETFDLEACRQLRASWDLARVNYTKHLVRTGEHYGVTSKTYKLTEEKWAATDAAWRRNNETTITNTVENGNCAFATLKHTTFRDATHTNVMTKIPSLNDPRSEGKFPQLGDEDIVGPMVQVAAQLQRSPSKKAKLFKFFAEKFPAGLGRP